MPGIEAAPDGRSPAFLERAREAVEDGSTGVLYRSQSPGALAEAMAVFDDDAFDSAAVRAHAGRFDVSTFDAGIARIVAEALVGERAQGRLRAVMSS